MSAWMSHQRGRGKVPVLGPGVVDLDDIEMDVCAPIFDKYADGFLELPVAKIKDLISHAAMLPEAKRPQHSLLALGREEELAAYDSESITERMDLGLALRIE